MDAAGRVRLDAVARFLQDAAIDDVEETGWGIPDHLWVIRKIQVDVVAPLLRDRSARDRDLVQRRRGDCGGPPLVGRGRRGRPRRDRQRLDPPRPRSAAGPDRRLRAVCARPPPGAPVSTKLALPDPPADAGRVPWALRSTDLDANGHVNNAVYWQAVEDWLRCGTGMDRSSPYRAELDYRDPIDLDDRVELAAFAADGEGRCVAFLAGGRVRAVAAVGPLGS